MVAINASEIKVIKERGLQKQAKQFLWVTLGSSVLIVLIIGLLFRNYKIRKRLKEAQLALEKKQLKEKLKNTKSALDVFVKEVHEKALSKKPVLTEANFRDFFQHFNKVDLGFVVSLKKLYPGVTKVEVLFCCLTLLCLSDKQMAAMLGLVMAQLVLYALDCKKTEY